MINKRISVMLMVLWGLQQGCVYTRANVDYDTYQDQIIISQDKIPEGKPLGLVRADSKGAAWDDCETLVQKSLLTLADEARAKGGNALGEIRWIPDDDHVFASPRCKRRWGFALFFPLLLSPLFMSATVEAQAYKINLD